MLRDVFYYGDKPNVHPREQFAENLADARTKATTRDFWIINEFCDYRNFDWDFDFEFLPDEDVWAEDHNNVWPSQHQKDSGTWLCPKVHSDIIIYRNDVGPVIRKNEKNANWVELDLINYDKFDFSWHPDPTDPPYIYKWPCKFFPAEFKHVLEYHVLGATQEKYMNTIAELVPEYDRWVEHQLIDKDRFDMSWRPNPLDPPFIYVWGNKHIDGTLKPTLEYHAPGATDKKYMPKLIPVLPEWERWKILQKIDMDSFDFTWRPDPKEPPFTYVFGNESYDAVKMPTIMYNMPDGPEIKYMDNLKAKLSPNVEKFRVLIPIDKDSFDFAWVPDPDEPPYIYTWGNQWNSAEIEPTVEFRVEGATQRKFMDATVTVLSDMSRWVEIQEVDKSNFDFSWRPDPTSPPYIYTWGNKWIVAEDRPTLEYHSEGATDRKYMSNDVPVLPEQDRWRVLTAIEPDSFDFTWRPDPKEPPFTYVFGNELYDAVKMPTVMYNMPEGPEVKYIDTLKAKLAPNVANFKELIPIDRSSFDYRWVPDPDEPPYIYTWGNQWNIAEVEPTVEFHVEGATQRKFMNARVTVLPDMARWVEVQEVDKSKFDFSWRPDPTSPPYIYTWGNKWIDAELKPTIEYRGQNATERKYMTNDVIVLPEWDRWVEVQEVDKSKFDFTWRPDPREPDYIYTWGNKWIDAELRPTLEYHCKGATEPKYMGNDVTVMPESARWKIVQKILPDSFDFTWRPDPREPPFTYVFGNDLYDAIKMPTIMYNMPNGPKTKYVHDITAKLAGNRSLYEHLEDAELEDYSWLPDPDSPPYIYAWGNQWNKPEDKISVQFTVPGATQYKYMEQRAIRKPDMSCWEIPDQLVLSSFDFSWEPNPKDPPYVYQFGTQWHETGGPKYILAGATEYKYIEDIKAKTSPNRKNWEILEGVDVSNFDFSWVPHPKSPPYIYQFGTQLDNADGPRYITPNNTGEIVYLERVNVAETLEIAVGQYYIETTLDDLVNEHPNEVFWALRKNINYDTFDFNWQPASLRDLEYVQVFGSVDSELTQTYYVSAKNYLRGNKDFKFVEDLILDDIVLPNIFVKPDMFFVDRSNPESAARFEALRAKYGTRIQKTRYLNSWVDTINRCINRSTTELLWVLNSELDYSDFNFEYYPNPWQMKMVQVFGTQWSHWGTTFMVNRETFAEDTKYIKIIEHLSNLNFVKDIRAKSTKCVHDIVVVDHGNRESIEVVNLLRNKAADRNVTVVKYDTGYLNTLKDIIKRQPEKKEHFIWVCSSVCDYTNFDFTYIIDPFARDSLHVFPSGTQKFGDTFFIDVNNARTVINELETLESFTKVNYNNSVKAIRLPEPIIVISDDTHTNSVDKITDFPYATLITSDNVDIGKVDIEPMNLWSVETKNIFVTSTGATRIVVPKEIKDHVTKELYEYPYIKRAPKLALSKPLDIVFLSNGETGAEEHYEHLLNITKNLPNRVVRVDGVNGRAAAYHAAAEASETPWMFTVFAKLKVSPKFDFNWQPDRMQSPKHYIFHAKNPVNGLTYGHQAMIAYNKKLTLANDGKGLDFTLDDEHEVVPLISGVAQYNTDEFSTWRTAFREVIKLRADESDVSKARLDIWLNKAEGEFAQYSIKGALDADEYYDEVDGDFEKLKLSYEWAWLREKFDQI